MDIALLGLRLVIGFTFVAHAAPKLFRVFGGGGIQGTADAFDQIGLRPSKFNAWIAALTELGGGILIALGLVTPFAAAGLVSVMTAAVLTVHVRQGFFATNNGYEYNLVLVAAAFALAGTGPGKWSLDNALHIDLSGTSWALGALGAGVLAGLATVAVGRLGAARGTDHGQPDAA
jgi:putative oxidoreductase